jgi:hypothetical protein
MQNRDYHTQQELDVFAVPILCSDCLYNGRFSSPNILTSVAIAKLLFIIIRTIKSRRMRWTGHVARMGSRGMHIGFWWKSQKEIDHQDELNVGKGDNIKINLGEIGCGVMDWIDLLRIGTSGGLYRTR